MLLHNLLYSDIKNILLEMNVRSRVYFISRCSTGGGDINARNPTFTAQENRTLCKSNSIILCITSIP